MVFVLTFSLFNFLLPCCCVYIEVCKCMYTGLFSFGLKDISVGRFNVFEP